MVEKYFNRSRIDPERKLRIVSLFAAGETETSVAEETGAHRRTVYSIFRKIRERIFDRARQDSEVFYNSLKTDPRKLIAEHESAFAESAKRQHRTPFLFCFKSGAAHIEILRFTSGIYDLCGKLKSYYGLDVISDCGVIYPIKRFYKADIEEGKYCLKYHPDLLLAFRYFAATHLKKFRGITRGTLTLHMKECQWRFNNRNSDLYPKILELLENNPI